MLKVGNIIIIKDLNKLHDYKLNKYPVCLPDRINKEFLERGILFILGNNNFCFDGDFYKQSK